MAEEIGTLGPMISSDTVAADFIRSVLFSLWANDCRALLWWCAFDQDHLSYAPYDWEAHEGELGLVRSDGTSKPVLKEIAGFGSFLKDLPFDALPERRVEAVCLLSEDQDQWGVAFSTFILAKQAGFDLAFRHDNQPLPEADLYLVPSMKGSSHLTKRRWLELIERVRGGATLYVSHDDCFLSPFDEPFGLEVQSRQRRTGQASITLGKNDSHLTLPSEIRLNLKATGAEVLAAEPDGNPAFTCNRYGQGQIFFLTLPIESQLALIPASFHGDSSQPFYKIYQSIGQSVMRRRCLSKTDPALAITEHPCEDGRLIAVVINQSTQPIDASLKIDGGWELADNLRGEAKQQDEVLLVKLSENDAAVLVLTTLS